MPPLASWSIGGGVPRAAAAKVQVRPAAVIGCRQAMLRSSSALSSPHIFAYRQPSSFSSVAARASPSDDADKTAAAAVATDSSPSSYSQSFSKFIVIENDKLPLGKPTFEEKTAGAKGAIKFRLAFALPWSRFKSDSVLVLEVSGAIGEKKAGRFAPSALTMPQVRV